jgi:ATP-dependent HslUV protease subunit HslV
MTYGTTIICVRKDGEVTMIGDGQVSLGSTIVKPNAKKVRRIGDDENILAGFAGATADCLTLVERLERKLTEYPG